MTVIIKFAILHQLAKSKLFTVLNHLSQTLKNRFARQQLYMSLVMGFESLSFSRKFSNRIIEVITQLNKLLLKIISFFLQTIYYDLDFLIASIVIIEFPTDGFYLTVNSLYLFFA